MPRSPDIAGIKGEEAGTRNGSHGCPSDRILLKLPEAAFSKIRWNLSIHSGIFSLLNLFLLGNDETFSCQCKKVVTEYTMVDELPEASDGHGGRGGEGGRPAGLGRTAGSAAAHPALHPALLLLLLLVQGVTTWVAATI